MEQAIRFVIIGYLIIMSVIGFTLIGADKRKAVNKAWRIPEKTLLITACFGGGIGSFFGMYIFHHKTRHIKFVMILPVAAMFFLAVLLKTCGIM